MIMALMASGNARTVFFRYQTIVDLFICEKKTKYL